MMSKSQFNLSYNPGEDRLLLQMNSPDNSNFKFFLTRRLTKQLMDAMVQVMHKHSEVQVDEPGEIATMPSPEAKEAMQSFEHASAVEQADFDTPFKEEAEHHPFGDNIILLHTIQLSLLKDQSISLKLMIDEEKSLDIHLDNASLHALYQIFSQTITAAEWDITTEFLHGDGGAMGRIN